MVQYQLCGHNRVKLEHSLKGAKMRNTQLDKSGFTQCILSQADMNNKIEQYQPAMTGLKSAISAGRDRVKTCNLGRP
jgi:hypothetical protein